jgi:hypothetical protein
LSAGILAGVKSMRSVQVQYPSGREVLNSYWGFLKHGGLVLDEPSDLAEGDPITLDVRIRTLKQSYHFVAQVVRRASDGHRVFVAFDAGQDQDVMLNAAWADTHECPQRKHRRFPVSSEIRYTISDDPAHVATGRLMNVSRGGCCMKGSHSVPVGARLRMSAEGFELIGKVRWLTKGCEMGIEFVPSAAAEQLLRQSA